MKSTYCPVIVCYPAEAETTMLIEATQIFLKQKMLSAEDISMWRSFYETALLSFDMNQVRKRLSRLTALSAGQGQAVCCKIRFEAFWLELCRRAIEKRWQEMKDQGRNR